jgi:hypothetical protein
MTTLWFEAMKNPEVNAKDATSSSGMANNDESDLYSAMIEEISFLLDLGSISYLV